MAIYPKITRNVVLPLTDILTGTSISRHLRSLEKSQWWSRSELEEYQNRKLRELVKHAYDTVPYYHRVFREQELHPTDIRTTNDLKKLPVITKETILANFDDFLSKDQGRLRPVKHSTGGTTGKTFHFYMTKDARSIGFAVKIRAWKWGGYRYGEKKATLGGSSLIPEAKPGFGKKLRLMLERNLPLSAAHMSEEIVNGYVRELRAFDPHVLRGYPSSVYSLCKFLSRKNITGFNIRSVFVTAEVLQPYQRELIENTFNCEVFDTYGCADGGGSANECGEHNGLHASIDRSILEVVEQEEAEGRGGEDVSPGERGRMLWTDIFNYAMPFIRYSPEDIGVLSPETCSCNRGLPLLEAIEGRTTDIISFSNGVSLGGPAFTLIFKDFRIEEYQLVQKTADSLLIRLVKGKDYPGDETQKILDVMRYHCGEGVELTIEFVEEMEKTPSSKFRFIISEVQS